VEIVGSCRSGAQRTAGNTAIAGNWPTAGRTASIKSRRLSETSYASSPITVRRPATSRPSSPSSSPDQAGQLPWCGQIARERLCKRSGLDRPDSGWTGVSRQHGVRRCRLRPERKCRADAPARCNLFPCTPGRGSLLLIQRLGGMTDATAGVHRGLGGAAARSEPLANSRCSTVRNTVS
jgi:hypothetical protein